MLYIHFFFMWLNRLLKPWNNDNNHLKFNKKINVIEWFEGSEKLNTRPHTETSWRSNVDFLWFSRRFQTYSRLKDGRWSNICIYFCDYRFLNRALISMSNRHVFVGLWKWNWNIFLGRKIVPHYMLRPSHSEVVKINLEHRL